MNLVRSNTFDITFRPDIPSGASGADTATSLHEGNRKPQEAGNGVTALVYADPVTSFEVDVLDQAKSLLDAIQYDDEVDYDFLRERLLELLHDYGISILNALDKVMSDRNMPAWKIGELIAWLGQIAHASTYQKRRYILRNALLDSRVAVRDGAISALAALGDVTSVLYLEYALGRETRPELKISLKKVIQWLQRD